MRMRKIVSILSALSLLAPVAVFATSDVTLSPSTVISVGGINVNVASGNAVLTTLTVDASSFSFTLAANEYIDISQSNGYKLSHTAGASFVVSSSCSSSLSEIVFKSITGPVTITVTPSTAACTGGSSSTGGNGPPVSSGGGGGGGGGYVPYTSPAATTTATTSAQTTSSSQVATAASSSDNSSLIAALQAQLNALLAQIASLTGQSVGTSFTRDLEVGVTGDDVQALQQYLNNHGYTLASTGPGSPGNETTMFGGLTRAAVKKLQEAAGITPVAGYFGPKTRAYVEAHP